MKLKITLTKIKRMSKSLLSILMVLSMLLSTFCIFDIGSLVSKAAVDKYSHDLNDATHLTSNYFSTYSLNFTEMIYLKSNGNESQYFLNNNSDGSVVAGYSEEGTFDFSCKTAGAVRVSVQLLDSNLNVPEDGNFITSVSFSDGTIKNNSNSDRFTVYTYSKGTIKTKISSVKLDKAVFSTDDSPKEYIIKWTVAYVCEGKEFTTYAYTGVYAPNIRLAGMLTKDRRIKKEGILDVVQYDVPIFTAFSYIVGAQKYGGGNYSVKTEKINPLADFYDITAEADIALVARNYFSEQNNGGVFADPTPDNNDGNSVPDSHGKDSLAGYRTYKTTWSQYGSYNVPRTSGSTTIYFGNASGGSVAGRLNDTSNYTTKTYNDTTAGVAYLLVDSSRYTDYSQIPGFGAGFISFYTSRSESSFRSIQSIDIAVDSDNPNGKIKSKEIEDGSISRYNLKCLGPYELNGSVNSGFELISLQHFEKASGAFAADNPIYVNHTIGVVTETINRGTLRYYYYKYLNSGVNTADTTHWNEINTKIEALVKKLCTVTGKDVGFTTTGFDDLITASQDELKNIMVNDSQTSEMQFVAPEQIYLYPNGISSGSTTATPFQYFIENTVDTEDLSKKPSPKSETSTEGNIYFICKNAKSDSVYLSYRWLDNDYSTVLSPASGYGYFKFKSETNAFYPSNSSQTYKEKQLSLDSSDVATCTISRDGSMSPQLSAGKTGAVIEWKLRYTDETDGYEKCVVAYTYVYKPYVVPLVGGGEAEYDSGYAGMFGWISGSHSITSLAQSATWEDDKDASGETRYRRYAKLNDTYGCSTFISAERKGYLGSTAYTGGYTRLTNDELKGGNSNGAPSYATGATDWYAIFAGAKDSKSNAAYFDSRGTNSSGTVCDGNFNNSRPNNWASESSSASTFSILNFNYVEADGDDYCEIMCSPSSTADIYVDISRYSSNLKDIPNLGIGLMVTDDEGSGDNTGGWYVASYTGLNGRSNRDGCDSAKYKSDTAWGDIFNDRGSLICSQCNKDSSGNLQDQSQYIEHEGIRYAGPWPESIDTAVKGSDKNYRVKMLYNNKDGGYAGMVSVILNLKATQLDKSALRDIVYSATMNMSVLGVYNENLDSYYFKNETVYNNFKNYYKDACAALTVLDGTYSSYNTQAKIDVLANNLSNSITKLLGGTDTDGNVWPGGENLAQLTVKQVNIGLTPLVNGEVVLEVFDTHTTIAQSRDNVYFTLDEYEGYTFDGSIRVSSDVGTIANGTKMHSPVTDFMSSSSYAKYNASLSGGYLTVTQTSNNLIQQTSNGGIVVEDKSSEEFGNVTYNWATRQDGDMILYYFYTKNQYITYFNLNYDSLKTNVAPVGEYSTYNHRLFPFSGTETNGEVTVCTKGDFSVKYNPETDVFTFNGELPSATDAIFSSLLSHLAQGQYTDSLYYVGGTITKTSGYNLTISESFYLSTGGDRTSWHDWLPAGDQASTGVTRTPNSIIASNHTYNYAANSSAPDRVKIHSWCEANATDSIKYKYDNYKIRFAKVNGSIPNNVFSPNARILFYGEMYETLPRPVREDYDFLGWYTDPEGGERIDSSAVVGVGDKTYYAHWRPANRQIRLDNEFSFNDWAGCNAKTSTDASSLASSASGLTASLTKDGYNDTVLACKGTSTGYVRTPELTFDGKETDVSMRLNIIDFIKNSDTDKLYIRIKTNSGTTVQETIYTDTTPGFADVNFDINDTQMTKGTKYYIEIGVSGNVKSRFEVKKFTVSNTDNMIIFSLTDSMDTSSDGYTKVDKVTQSILLTSAQGKTDTYTQTYNYVGSYKMKLKPGTTYTLSFDYNVVSSGTVNIVPYLFYFPTKETSAYSDSLLNSTSFSVSGTGSAVYEFSPKNDNPYVEIRFGINTENSSVLINRIVIQETYIYDQKEGKYDSVNKLGGLTNNSADGYISASIEELKNQDKYWEHFISRYNEVEINSKFDGLDVPTRDGYMFMGWYTQPGGAGTQVTDRYGNSVGDTVVTDDTVLYSQWVKAIYQLLYENEFIFENWDSTVAITDNINQHEYRDDFTNSITLEGRGVATSPRTNTYTMQLISGHTYEFTCDVENVSETNSAEYWALPKVAINYGETSYPQAGKFVKANGTDNTSSISKTFTMSGSTFTIYFYHSAYGDGNRSYGYDGVSGMLNSASVKFTNIHIRDLTDPCNLQASDKENTVLITKQKDVRYSEKFGELPSTKSSTSAENNISRTGYDFKGWFSSQNATGNGYGTKYTSDTVTALNDVPMYAQWALKNPTVSINLNGSQKYTAEMGAFTYYTSTLNTSTGAITKDISTSVAKTTSNANAVTATITPYYSSTVTLPIPTKAGYSFISWSVDTEQPKAVLTSNGENSPSTYKVGDGDATLTANWAVNDYTIQYEMNNGENAASNTDPNSATKACQFDSAVEITKPTKTGWVFEGWSLTTDTAGYSTAEYYTTDANNTTAIENGTTYFGKDNDSIYVINLTPTKDYTVTLTAHWSKVITANINTIKASTYAVETQVIANTIHDSETSTTIQVENPANYTKNGKSWTFAGWRSNTDSEFPEEGLSLNPKALDATEDDNTVYNFYAVYNEPTKVNFHYYNGTAHAMIGTSLYTIANGSKPENLYSDKGKKHSADWTPEYGYDGATFKEWANNDTIKSVYGLTRSSTNENYYAIYEKEVSLTYNLNDSTAYPASFENPVTSPEKKNACYISNLGRVNTFNNSFTVTTEEPTRESCMFLFWSEDANDKGEGSGTARYVGGQSVMLESSTSIKDKTIYAIWFATDVAEDAIDSDIPQETVDVAMGYKEDGTEKWTSVLKYSDDSLGTYSTAINEYNTARQNYETNRKNSKVSLDTLISLRGTLVSKIDALNSALENLSKRELQTQYFNNFYSLDGKQHSVAEMNLNYYNDYVLDTVKNAKVYGDKMAGSSYTVDSQDTMNDYVLAMADGFTKKTKIESNSPIYSVTETKPAVSYALNESKDIDAVNYVYAGKGNYTYYCYTNTPNPRIVLDVDEADATGKVITNPAVNTASYPTISTASTPVTTNGAKGQVLLTSIYSGGNPYSTYLSSGMGTAMKVTYQDGENNANVTYSYDSSNSNNNYYNRKSRVILCADFSSAKDKATVAYTITSHDDAYDSVNVATKSSLDKGSVSEIPSATAGADGKSITIIIDYHYTDQLKATGDQFENDKFLNQYHLIRASGGASNWELPAYGDSIYSEWDESYGTNAGYGSFTYTFAPSKFNDLNLKTADGKASAISRAIGEIKKKDFANLYKNYESYNKAYDDLYNAAYAYAKSKNSKLTSAAFKNSFAKDMYKYLCSDYVCTNVEAMTLGSDYFGNFFAKNVEGCIAKYKAEVAKQSTGVFIGTNIPLEEGRSGDGLGFIPWGSNYSFNYYPASNAYTYVHLIDRWGNVFDDVVKTPNIDANSPITTSSVGTTSIVEYGGSGIDTMNLSGAKIDFILDAKSTFSDNVYSTGGNEIKISTGVPNTSYQLTVNDRASNSTTETVTSDENGIIIISVRDKAYEYDEAYTFTLNGTTVNIYEGTQQNTVVDATVEGSPAINTNAIVDVTVNGSPDLVKLVEKDNPSNTVTVQRNDASISASSGQEVWQIKVYVDKLTSTYYVSAKFDGCPASNYVELVIVASEGADLTIHSMVISDMVGDNGITPVANNGRIVYGVHKITITTTTDVRKIQFVDSRGNTWTYDSINSGLINDENGIRTWTISLNFCIFGDWKLTVRTRSNTTSFASGVGEDLHAFVL